MGIKSFRKLIATKKIKQHEEWFEAISFELFCCCRLMIKGRIYEIIEVEFYVNENDHPDVFSHSTIDQKQNGFFCFHRTGTAFREGNYKGVDIAIGSPERFGGILIRSLRDEESGRIIEGPSNVVGEILRLYKVHKVRDLVLQVDLNIEGQDLCLVEHAGPSMRPLRTPRVGLTLKKQQQEKIFFLVRDYRFIKYPEMLKKGRHWIIAALLLRSSAHGLPKGLALKYERWLNRGKHHQHFGSIKLGPDSLLSDFVELYGFFNK